MFDREIFVEDFGLNIQSNDSKKLILWALPLNYWKNIARK